MVEVPSIIFQGFQNGRPYKATSERRVAQDVRPTVACRDVFLTGSGDLKTPWQVGQGFFRRCCQGAVGFCTGLLAEDLGLTKYSYPNEDA